MSPAINSTASSASFYQPTTEACLTQPLPTSLTWFCIALCPLKTHLCLFPKTLNELICKAIPQFPPLDDLLLP